MKLSTGAFVKAAAFVVAALLILIVVIHTEAVENAVRRQLVTAIEDRLGGRAAVETLEYRLWKGEVVASGVAWTSADDGVAVRVDRVLVFFFRQPASVSLEDPEIRVRSSESGGDSAVAQLPGWLFAVEAEVSGGRIVVDGLEVDAVDVSVAPEGGEWLGTWASGPLRFASEVRDVGADASSARFRLGPASAEILESRIDASSSVIEAVAEFDAFSPLAVRADVTFSIDEALVRELAPDVRIGGAVAGDANVRGTGETWTASGSFAVEKLTYPPLEPVAASVPWRFDAGVFYVDGATVSGYGGEALVSASTDLAANVTELDVSVTGVRPHASLAASVNGTAKATVPEFDISRASGEASFELTPERRREGVPLGGNVRVTLVEGIASVSAPRLRAAGLDLRVAGRVGERIELHYVVGADELAEVTLVPEGIDVSGAARIVGTVSGSIDEPRASAELTTDAVSVYGVPVETNASLSFNRGTIEVAPWSIRHASGGALTLRGAYDLDSGTLSLRGSGDAFVLRDIPELEASIMDIDVAIEGPVRALTGSARASIRDAEYRGVAFPDTDFVVAANGSGSDVTGTTAGNEWIVARVMHEAPYPSELELDLSSVPAGELLRTLPRYGDTELVLDGWMRASVELARPSSFRYSADVEQIVGSYRDVGFGASRFAVSGDAASLTVRELTLVGADTAIGIDGTAPLTRDGALDLEVRGVARLELLSSLLPDVAPEGRVGLELRASGSVETPSITGDLTVSEAGAIVAGTRIDGVFGDARFNGDRLTLDEVSGTFMGGRVRLDGEIAFFEGGDARVRFVVDDVDPIGLLDADDERDLALRLSGSGELTVAAALEPTAWQGRGSVSSIDASVGGFAVDAPEPAAWELDGGVLRLRELRLVGDGTDFLLSGEARPFAEPLAWNARATGRLDPRVLGPALADLGVALGGDTELDVRASGSAESVALAGGVSLRNGRLALREPPLVLTDVTGDVVFDGDTIEIESFQGNVGGGSVRAGGSVRLAGASIESIEIEGSARSVFLSYPDGLRSEIDGALRLTGTPAALTLSGDVTLDRAIFSRNISLQSELLESLSRARILPQVDSVASRTRLDVRVRAQGIRVDNNLAEMDASANLVVGGTVAEPAIDGTVAAREGGEFRFGRHTYRIETARLSLAGYPSEPPVLDVTARTTVSTYDIRLNVEGPTDNLVSNLSGTSRVDWRESLTAADAASLLVTGRKVENVSAQGREILGEQMASYLGASLGELAQFGLGGALPFDIVTEEPTLIAGEADPSARFTLGAALTERLSLVYSIGLNNAEKQIWIVDFQLPRRTRSQLIRQEDNEYTFAFGQQFRVDRSPGAVTDSRARIRSVAFYFVTSEPGNLDVEARSQLGLDSGADFEYWQAWERVEGVREWLHEHGFLDSIADLRVSGCGAGCVELEVFVLTGKRVHFAWTGDSVHDDVKASVVREWDGNMTREFLAADLESVAEGELFRRRYYLASVTVGIEELPEETVVSIDVASGPRGERVDVALRGNQVPAEQITSALPRRASAEFHELITSKRPRLRQILEVRYASLGYLQAEIGDVETGYDEATGVFAVTIPVVEGEPSVVGRVDVEGVEGLDESLVRSRLSLAPGQPFRLSQFVQDRSSLASFYRRQGFPDAEVDSSVAPGETPGSLIARYVVREGPEVTVGSIRIDGNTVTRDGIIAREVALEPGKPLRLSDVSRTQKNLYGLGVFRSADVVVVSEANAEGSASVRDVVIEVAEAPDATFDYGVRFSTDGSFQVQGDARAPNLFGRAQGVAFRALVGSSERIFRASYRTPYVVGFKVATDLFVERRVAEETSEAVAFRERDWRFTAQQSLPFREKMTFQWSYSFKRTGMLVDDNIIDPFDFTQNQSIVTTSLIGDFRNSVVDPSRGSLWNVTVQGSPQFFASDFKYVKFFAQAFTYVGLGGDLVWAGGYRAGAINNLGQTLLPDDLFQAGGPSSVRGFEQSSLGPPLGGEGLVVINQELRFPIVWRLRGAGFYDAGNVFASPSQIRLSELRQNIGAGVRLTLPFGLIRFDWARVLDVREGEDAWRFVFSLGHAF